MAENITELTNKFRERVQGKPAFGKKAKIVLTELGAVMLDGTGPTVVVTNQDTAADVTLSMSVDTLKRMQNKELNGMEAFFQGLLTVEGDQAVAMSLADVLDLD